MKRILISLLLISVSVGAVVGITNAFFSDTETSTGNILSAGSIDLTIDHTFASYNGVDCSTCQVLPGSVNLVANGDFESPIVSAAQKWDAFPHATVGGWSAEWINPAGAPNEANIELHAGVNIWAPQSGSQYTELDSDWDGPSGGTNNESARVKIYQDIATEAGKKYELRFWHSYRPEQNAQENEMIVRWNGVQIEDITDANGVGKTQTEWREYVREVNGNGSTIRLEFEASGPNNSLGVFLDNVSLREMTCGHENGQCNLWSEKDLDKGDIIWNFDDIKPGDYGRDVISLHVNDNDSWLCTFFAGTDKENSFTDPEEEAGDTTSGEDQGELSEELKLFAWWDTDNDGIYDPGEIALHENGFGPIIPIVEPSASPFLGGTTGYIGMAWCAGTQSVNHDTGEIECDGSTMGNKSQTDSYLLDVNFYAEQSRNNPDFKCSEVLK
ncbi:hypothetical protein C4564_02050 [Candidatus Microgenomates bacterium]|nr:MAG: hypothetical protein C4564_02050 [Candidatus Microgenomates bacterium]